MALLVLATVLLQEPTPEQLIERLRSDSFEERNVAARALKELGNDAIPNLNAALKDKDQEVVYRVRQLLQSITVRKLLTPNLLRTVVDIEDRISPTDDHTWTVEFLRTIGRRREGKPYPGLRHEDLEAVLLPALRGASSVDEKVGLSRAVRKYRLMPALPWIVRLLGNDDIAVRSEAIETLGCLGSNEVIPVLAPLLKDENETVSTKASDALAKLGAKDLVPNLIEMLGSEGNCPGFAALALAKLEASQSSGAVMRVLKDADPFNRRSAAIALGHLHAKEAIAEIMALTKDPDVVVRRSAANSLADLVATEAVPLISNLLKDPDDGVRIEALEALSRLGAISDAPRIVECAGIANPRVKRAAIRALERLGASEDGIQRFLDDANPQVQLQAAQSLTRIGSKRGVPELLRRGVNLSSLNAVRSPDAWAKVTKGTTFKPVMKGTAKEILEQVSRATGFELEWKLPSPDEDVLSWTGQYHVLTVKTSALLDFIDWLEESGQCSAIIELNVVRLVSRETALGFWKSWWDKVPR